MRRFLLTLLSVCLLAVTASGQRIERIEPLNWWIGMQTDLQIMFYGNDIGGCNVTSLDSDLKVTSLHKADSANYLFVDVAVDPNAKAGDYRLLFSGSGEPFEVSYTLSERREGSGERVGFGTSDMLYLLMPDRFANGDPSNDTTPDTADQAPRSDRDGRHGGDIKGIIDHLDYLASLGVTALWSTPLLLDNELRCSYHGYACADYYRIDPRFGSNELYRTMVDEAHQRGIKVVMDFVTNHCGTAHRWMNDLPFDDWINKFPTFTRSNYAMSSYMDPNASQYDQDICKRGWFDTTMPDMNLCNPFVVRYFAQAAVWWIEWAGLDGLRVDTFPYNDRWGIAEWCHEVRKEYPSISIVGECWFHSADQIAFWEGGHSTNIDGYDSNLTNVMDFQLCDALGEVLRSDRTPRWDGGVMSVYNSLSHDFVYDNPLNLMIFMTNHDTTRSADVARGDKDALKIAMTLLATMRGMPQLYAGDETMLRADDPNGGDGAKRIDFPGGWKGDRVDLFTARGRDRDQNELFDHIARLFNWRKGKEVIHSGRTLHFIPSDNCYVYFRYNSSDKVMVVANCSFDSVALDWNRYGEIVDSGAEGVDLLSGSSVKAGELLTVAPRSSLVIEFR